MKPLSESNFNYPAWSIELNTGVAAALEAQRLSVKYNKDFFDANDLVKLMGLGEANVRKLMAREDFPVIKIGNRSVVSVLALAIWMTDHNGDKTRACT